MDYSVANFFYVKIQCHQFCSFLCRFFTDNIHNKYNIYYYGFIFCETLNVFIVVAAYFMTNRFLNGEFLFYGFKTWLYYKLPPEEQRLENHINPMCKTFPRIAACDYHRFGSGGKQEKVNAICILALNIINDKVRFLKKRGLLFTENRLFFFPRKHKFEFNKELKCLFFREIVC